MSRSLRFLVVEGNTKAARMAHAEVAGHMPSEQYAETLREMSPECVVDIAFPADEGANLPDAAGLESYDAIVLTGSALSLWKGEPESLRQVEFAKAAFASKVPFFGSCWGIQVASAASGGSVRKNPKGSELAFARKITLTEAGRAHPLHAGRPHSFDAPAMHEDEVETRPEGMVVTATNAMSEVQAAEIRHLGGTFWGVQYHPEFPLSEVAAILQRYGSRMVDKGFVPSLEALQAHLAALRKLDAEPQDSATAWPLGLDKDVLDAQIRLTEIRNFIEARVKPEASRRGRA